MIKYILTATSLKAISSCLLTQKLYRKLGNIIGNYNRTKGKMPQHYFDRVNRMLSINRSFGVPQDGIKILEIGTGWLHWEAITARLFFNVECVLFDIWDNRQMVGMKNYIIQLDKMLDKLDTEEAKINEAHRLISKIIKVERFEDLYNLLGFKYIVDKNGDFSQLGVNTFDYVVSAAVLQHVDENIMSKFINDIATTLKPGGYSYHSINLRDQLLDYDNSVSPKQYLRYSDHVWNRWFNNDITHVNRIQRPEWLELFKKAGLELVKEEIDIENVAGMKIADKFKQYDEVNLNCVGLRLLHRKPK
jgi:SAM-dependent methyltransferase